MDGVLFFLTAAAVLMAGPLIGYFLNIYFVIAVTALLIICWWQANKNANHGNVGIGIVLLWCSLSVILMWITVIVTRWGVMGSFYHYVFSDQVYQFLKKYILR